MIEQQAAKDIRHGFTHYTGKPVTPGAHSVVLVPQSIVDGWEALCSCGEWRAFESFYAIPARDDLIAALRKAHALHAEA